jgi:hypothetical protein
MSLRVTQQYAMALGTGSGAARITRQYAMVLGSIYRFGEAVTPCLVTQTASAAYIPGGWIFSSDTLTTSQTVAGRVTNPRPHCTTALALTQVGTGRNITLKKTAATAITWADTLDYIGPKVASAGTTITLVGEAGRQRNWVILESATSSATTTQALSVIGPITISIAPQVFALGQYADTRLKTRASSSEAAITQLATCDRYVRVATHVALEQGLERGMYRLACETTFTLENAVRNNQRTASAISTVEAVQGSLPNVSIQQRNGYDTWELDQSVNVVMSVSLSAENPLGYYDWVWGYGVFPDYLQWYGLAQSVSASVTGTRVIPKQYLQTNHLVSVLNVRADALVGTASTAVAFTQTTGFDKWASATTSLTLLDSCLGFSGPDSSQTWDVTQSAVANVVRNSLAAITNIALASGLGYMTDESVRCQYHPFIGGNTVSGLPNPPAAAMQPLPGNTGVQLYYPFGATSTYTWSTPRKPDFGNKDQLMFQRINRLTRGGRMVIFADPSWPKDHTMVMTFSSLTEANSLAYLTFLQSTLGQEIGLTDWMGRIFRGVITNIQDPVVRNSRDNNALTIHFNVTTRAYTCSATTATSLTQTMDREGILERSPSTVLGLTHTAARLTVASRSMTEHISPQNYLLQV